MFREKEICNAIRTAYLYLFPDKKERKRALSRLNMELVAQSVRYRGESVLAYQTAGNHECSLNYYGPVSYTHLDLYKRQALGGTAGNSVPDRLTIRDFLFSKMKSGVRLAKEGGACAGIWAKEDEGMQITRELIDYVADLSRLRLNEEEKDRAEKDLGSILTYMDKLNELDTAGVEPMSHAFPVKNVFREDEVRPSENREVLLQNAPVKQDGCFKVPKTVE